MEIKTSAQIDLMNFNSTKWPIKKNNNHWKKKWVSVDSIRKELEALINHSLCEEDQKPVRELINELISANEVEK